MFGMMIPTSFSQENVNTSKCDSLLVGAKKYFGCGQAFWQRNMQEKQATDCYAENNEIDKAIKFAESKVKDIDEQDLRGLGWTEKLIEYQRIKFGDKYVRSQLDDVKIKTEIIIDGFYLSFMDTASCTSIGAKVELLGKEYRVLSTIESKEKDDQIHNDFIMKKISRKELDEYFEKRWRESLLYNEIEKI